MLILNDKDYRLIEKLVSLSQKGMYESMKQYLSAKYDNVIVSKDYIVAVGNIPIALVAHMDTVFKKPVTNLYYDKDKGVLWSPEGLGADDRAGIFIMIKLIQEGLRPSIILTCDEEKGGVGAAVLAQEDCPIPNLKYMIQLDRRGACDCVFYECYNKDFFQYVSSFGFREAYGTFSDISFLMPEWEICGVNLSVGYEDEHSFSETLHISHMFDTIRKVKNMLLEKEIPDFEYDEISMTTPWWNHKATIFGQHCNCCKKLFSEYELFPIIGKDKSTKFYCPDCFVGNVEWCITCGEGFEIDPADKDSKKCKICAEVVCTKTSKNNLDK